MTTFAEACVKQAKAESDSGLTAEEYINRMTNYELLEFVERVIDLHKEEEEAQ